MKQISYFLLGLYVSFLTDAAAKSQVFPTPAKQGFTLLMHDFRILEGAYERLPSGDFRLVSKSEETIIPAALVKMSAENRDTIMKYLLSHGEVKKDAKSNTIGNGIYNTEAAKAFRPFIQPILMNQCASCHTKPETAGRWLLKLVPPGTVDPVFSELNLMETVLLMNKQDPSSSKLITYALTAHGGQKSASFTKREHPALERLECWTHGMMATEGTPIPSIVPVKTKQAPAVFVTAPTTPKPVTKPTTTTIPDDPFDPAIFNRGRTP